METKKITEFKTELVEKSGISKKTGKAYSMLFLNIKTELFGDVEVLLDTHKDKTGIIMEQIRKLFKEGG